MRARVWRTLRGNAVFCWCFAGNFAIAAFRIPAKLAPVATMNATDEGNEMVTAAKDNMSETDALFGYEFGVEGTVSREEATRILASCHRTTLWRLWKSGAIRKGRVAGKTAYCRRSILNYLKSTES